MAKCSCSKHSKRILKSATATQFGFEYNTDNTRSKIAPFDMMYHNIPCWSCNSCGNPVLNHLNVPVKSKEEAEQEGLEIVTVSQSNESNIVTNNSNNKNETKNYLINSFKQFIEVFESSLKEMLDKLNEIRAKYKSNAIPRYDTFEGCEEEYAAVTMKFKKAIQNTTLIKEDLLNKIELIPDTLFSSFVVMRKVNYFMDRVDFSVLRQSNEELYNYFIGITLPIKKTLENDFDFAYRSEEVVSSNGDKALSQILIDVVYSKPLCIKCTGIHHKCAMCDFQSTDLSDFTKIKYYKLSDVDNDQVQLFKDDIYRNNEAYICNDCGRLCSSCDEFIDLTVRHPAIQEHDGDFYHEDCFNELFALCDDCGDYYPFEELQSAPEPFNRRDDQLYCERHFNNTYTQCSECDNWINAEDVNEDGTCNNCYNPESDSEDLSDDVVEDISSHIRHTAHDKFFPLDEKVITGTIIPVLDSAIKKAKNKKWDESFKNEIVSKINSKEGKAAIESLWDNYEYPNGEVESSLKDLKLFFEKNRQYITEFKQKYPKLKGYRPLPVATKLEMGNGHPGRVIAIYPTPELLNYVDKLYPGAKEFYNKFLKNSGHHGGALAYMRLTESNSYIVIDNLQSDIDPQYLTKRYLDMDIYKKFSNLQQAYVSEARDLPVHENYYFTSYSYSRDFQTVEDLDTFIKISRDKRDETIASIKNYNYDNVTEGEIINITNNFVENAIALFQEKINVKVPDYIKVWGTIGKGFWAPYLLDMIKTIGTDADKKVYLTTFRMQQEKWRSIPEKNIDIYERTPQSMGVDLETQTLKPEDLPDDTYNLYRLAKKYSYNLFF